MELKERLAIQSSVDKLVADGISFRVLQTADGTRREGIIEYRRGLLDDKELDQAVVTTILNYLQSKGWEAKYQPAINVTFGCGERTFNRKTKHEDIKHDKGTAYLIHVFNLKPVDY